MMVLMRAPNEEVHLRQEARNRRDDASPEVVSQTHLLSSGRLSISSPQGPGAPACSGHWTSECVFLVRTRQDSAAALTETSRESPARPTYGGSPARSRRLGAWQCERDSATYFVIAPNSPPFLLEAVAGLGKARLYVFSAGSFFPAVFRPQKRVRRVGGWRRVFVWACYQDALFRVLCNGIACPATFRATEVAMFHVKQLP